MEDPQVFLYQLLSRMQEDCKYFLGLGNRNEKHLWAGSVDAQISEMIKIYDSLLVKPDWISAKEILEYEKQMKVLQ